MLYALSVSIVCPLLLAALLQRRMPGVCVDGTTLCFSWLTFDLHGGTAQLDVLTLYGLRLEGLLPALVLPLLLTMVLFAGPLVLGYFDEDLPGQSNFSWRSDVLATLTSYVGVRNFIVVWTRVCYVLASWFSVDLGTRNRRDRVSVLLRYNHVSRRLFQPDHRLLLPTVLWSWYILSPLAAFF